MFHSLKFSRLAWNGAEWPRMWHKDGERPGTGKKKKMVRRFFVRKIQYGHFGLLFKKFRSSWEVSVCENGNPPRPEFP